MFNQWMPAMFTTHSCSSSVGALVILIAAFHVSTTVHGEENWPRFRGVDGTGVAADDPRLPDTWDQEQNVRWRANVPGRGWGSPIVWGNRVFVSSVHSDDEYESPQAGLYLGEGRGDPPDTVHHWMVYCLDLHTGQQVWQQESHSGKPRIPRHPKSTYAAETPATDGKRIYVLFGDVGLYSYDLDGNLVWSHAIDPLETFRGYGAAASPVVQGDQVIMVYDNEEAAYIMAFDSASGDVRWKVPRDERSTWATPFVWQHDGTTEIVTTGKSENRSYSPDGELLWNFDGRMSVLTIPSPFVVDNLLYITSGYFQDRKRPVFAIRPGATGDITLNDDVTSNDFIQWSLQRMGPYNTSPIVYGGYYYTLLDRGMITCHDAKTGQLVYDRQRFPAGGTFTASPWAYNGKLFFLDEDGRTSVMPVGTEFRIEQTNSVDELCLATPSISQGNLLIRTASKIYCVSNETD